MAVPPVHIHPPQEHRPKRRFRPVFLLLAFLARVAPTVQPRVQKKIIQVWYQYLNAPGRGTEIAMMNYGYAPLTEVGATSETFAEDGDETEANRYGIALYRHVANGIERPGKDVLEVGCGRGGGAAFIKRYFEPCSVTGIDFAEKAIAFCRSRYSIEGLSFITGDAEYLPFSSDSFDVVVNVESSHCYPNFERFLQGVKQVLRPQGYFLFADFRSRDAVDLLRNQLHQSGLIVLQEEQITANVVRALDLDTERKLAFAKRSIPGPLQAPFKDFAGVRGSQAYQEFRSAKTEYLCFVLQKQ